MTSKSNKVNSKRPLLPGFGRPLNYKPGGAPDYADNLLPNALSDRQLRTESAFQRLITLREFAMLQFMNSVTDKIDWHIKVKDPKIAQKWKDEVCADPETDFTATMADRCIDELQYRASLVSPEHPPPIFVYNGDVVKSDTAVPRYLKEALQEAVKKFEAAIPETSKDWHPGSDGKVLDLVHPSLYPLVYGRTRILSDGLTTTLDDCIERCGQGEITEIPPEKERVEEMFEHHRGKNVYSAKFQWLPCEVDVSGENAKITSYINNLHPTKEKHLYGLIEKIIDASIPLWNATLAPLADDMFYRERRIDYTEVTYDAISSPDSEMTQQESDEDEDSYLERRLVLPEPKGYFQPLSEPVPFDLKSKYGSRGLQIIVKLANIQLTPDKPKYEGGTWHVEGQMNEHIVATALYYYSNDNVTTSTLSFRQQGTNTDAEQDVSYEQDDHGWLTVVFGCDGTTVQTIGDVETSEGRLLSFPNILQHRVSSFELADPTKPGHRKIVALFLVDPNIKVTSTAYVPCQQQKWWWEVIMSRKDKVMMAQRQTSAVRNVPIELQDNILRDVDFPFSMEEAKALRLELMKERTAFVVQNTESFDFYSRFSLCEH